jgi:3-phenylpropionate/trans-cinnamate dioxygenase ferredoxin subunit
MSSFIKALPIADIPENGNKAVEISGKSVLICNSQGSFYAIANECTHQRSPLEGGKVRGTFLFCPLHGVRFDLRNGMPAGNLTKVCVKTYETRVVDDWVEVTDPDGPSAS